MRIVALIAASTAALVLAGCSNNAEDKAPEAASEAAEASGIADEAAAASEAAQAEPAPATPVEGH